MAPYSLRDSFGIGNQINVTSRTRRQCANNSQGRYNLNIYEVSPQEEFFRSMGLRMKEECQYAVKKSCKRRKLNIPHGVQLRKCSVVIVGSLCNICGKSFKCTTDVQLHTLARHRACNRTVNSSSNSKENFNENLYNSFTNELESSANENRVGKSHKRKTTKIVLTIKIGKEVFARRPMKRKYLVLNTSKTSSQTDCKETDQLVKRYDDETRLLGVDTQLANGLHKCPLSNISLATNTYPCSKDVVPRKRARLEDHTAQRQSGISEFARPTRSSSVEVLGGTSVSRKEDLASNKVLCRVVLDIHQQSSSPVQNVSNDRVYEDSTPHVPFPILMGTSRVASDVCSGKKPAHTSPKKYVEVSKEGMNVNRRERDISTKDQFQEPKTEVASKKDTNRCAILIEHPMSPMERREASVIIEKNFGGARQDVPRVLKAQRSQVSKESVNRIEKNVSRKQHEQVKAGAPIEHPGSSPELLETSDMMGMNCTNGTQDVLRASKSQNRRTEVDQEPSNRSEREMLVMDAIEAMKSMEEIGLHLLGEKGYENVGKTANRRSNNSENLQATNKKTEKSLLNVPRNSAKAQKLDCTKIHSCMLDTSKENLIMHNGNLNIPSEELMRYGINYYNECLMDKVEQPDEDYCSPYFGEKEMYSEPSRGMNVLNNNVDYPFQRERIL